MLTWLSIGGAVMVVMLSWTLMKRFAADGIRRFVDARRPSSRLVTVAEFVDGNRHLPVSLALNGLALYYENSTIQASLDLQWIQDVEYEDELVTGQRSGTGKVLRLRCFGQVFEFILPLEALPRWQAVLPARSSSAMAAVVAPVELSRADDEGWPALPAPAEGVAS